MKAIDNEVEVELSEYDTVRECGFCHWTEHGKHGKVMKKWSWEWNMFISVCRKHSRGLITFDEWKAQQMQ